MKYMPHILDLIKKHKLIAFPIGILILVILIIIATRPSSVSKVETEQVIHKDITQSLSASGSIDSTQSVDLTFLAGGKLLSLDVQKGDAVKAGQIIAVLDQRSMQKNLETALRSYSIQRNTFEQTNQDHNAKAPKDAVNDAIKRILENNQYDLEKAVISVELQSLAKEQSVLVTPIDGIVTRADVNSAGVNVGPTTTFTVASPNSMVFKMEIDEADIGKVNIGQPVHVVLDSYPDQTLNLNVGFIDFATHTTTTGGNVFTVQANMPEQNSLQYRLGMSGDADIILQKKTHVLSIPIASIIDESFVYIKLKDSFEKRKVVLGLANDTDVQIISGLRKGDKVALDPTEAEKIKPKKFLLF